MHCTAVIRIEIRDGIEMFEVVTGGSGSGKSAFAEERICSLGEGHTLYYIAAMIPRGRETEEKIQKHRAMRAGKGFTTLEWPVDLNGSAERFPDFSAEDSCVLMECMSNLLANEMYSPEAKQAEDIPAYIMEGIRHLKEQAEDLIVIAQDAFSEVPMDPEMRRYVKASGRVNQMLAKEADVVVEVKFGLPLVLKGGEILSEVESR